MIADLPAARLRIYPDPSLRQRADRIPAPGHETEDLANTLLRFMYAHRGQGLAATQVGWPVRLFVCNTTADPSQPNREFVVVDPKIVGAKDRFVKAEEGCLSLPGLYRHIERPFTIQVSYRTAGGVQVCRQLAGAMARVFQHECDHLDGVLFIDHLPAHELAQVEPDLERMRVDALQT